jgi:dTMP kinase
MIGTPGRFIAIEGLDGSGGTTQTRLLAATLTGMGLPVLTTREPSDGPVGRLIRAALKGAGSPGTAGEDAAQLGDAVLSYLFAADRRDHLDREVLPALSKGTWVVSDRYLHSSLAYQSLAVGFDLVASLNAGFPDPDLTVMLDLAPAQCLARIAARSNARDRFENAERLASVALGYERALAWASDRGARILRTPAEGSPESIAARIREAVQRLRVGIAEKAGSL